VCVVVGQATGYPTLMEKLASYAATTVESRVQVDGRAVTSQAPGTTMEFAVALIEQLIGKEKADEVAGPLVRINSCLHNSTCFLNAKKCSIHQRVAFQVTGGSN